MRVRIELSAKETAMFKSTCDYIAHIFKTENPYTFSRNVEYPISGFGAIDGKADNGHYSINLAVASSAVEVLLNTAKRLIKRPGFLSILSAATQMIEAELEDAYTASINSPCIASPLKFTNKNGEVLTFGIHVQNGALYPKAFEKMVKDGVEFFCASNMTEEEFVDLYKRAAEHGIPVYRVNSEKEAMSKVHSFYLEKIGWGRL